MADDPIDAPDPRASDPRVPGDAVPQAANADPRILTEGMRTRDLPGAGGLPADAGEYVLGTLDTNERARFERLVEADPEARDLAAFWRERLRPLDEVAAPVAPPDDLWQRIERVLPEIEPGTTPANDNRLGALRRSRNGWRFAALAAGLLLVGAAVLVANPDLRGEVERRLGLPPLLAPGSGPAPGSVAPVAGAESYIAVVNSEGKLPAMIVRVDGATGRVSVRSLAIAQPEGRSLEVWHIPDGTTQARSLGVLEPGTAIRDVRASPGDTLAVTEEPSGGSPTGEATGPIVYSGQLVREPD